MSQSQAQAGIQARLVNEEAVTVSEFMHESQISYHEMGDVPVQKIDLFESLRQNLNQLEDVQHRLQFMMREIKTHIKF